MNAFFISCEQTRHPEISGKPAAVAGDPENRTGIILTANYEARKYGIRTTMTLREAFKLCPDLIIIPPDHRFYSKKSREVMEILSLYTPVIEQNSIDEAWLDMTGCEGIFGEPVEMARSIMERIDRELGLWCSIMASEMKKPHGITELWRKEIKEKMWTLPVSYIYGVGKSTTLKLQSMGIFTIMDLALCDSSYLFKKLGKMGTELSLKANGIDTSPVTPNSYSDMKSIVRSITLPQDVTDIDFAKTVLLELSDEVGMSARKHGKKGRTVQISIKYSDFKSSTRQTTVPATYLVKDIYSAGIKLLEKNWNNKPIRLLGISLSGFDENSGSEQLSLFQMPDMKDNKSDDRTDQLENAIYNIREKYGHSIIKPGALLDKDSKNN